jgi:co-chaperonin GroES (HSP10)
MAKFEPQGDWIIIERASQSKALVIPDKAEPVSDDVFQVVGVGYEAVNKSVKCGDLVCIVGYINTFSYKGEKVILAKASDIVCKIKEVKDDHGLGKGVSGGRVERIS